MRLTSRKKQSAIAVILFHDFAIDDAILLASYVIDRRADFLGRQQQVAAASSTAIRFPWSSFGLRLCAADPMRVMTDTTSVGRR
jgi:hypothetical protein